LSSPSTRSKFGNDTVLLRSVPSQELRDGVEVVAHCALDKSLP
jgi:hypothetical protein